MAKPKESASKKKIIDVQHPSKTSPSNTSKQVIVTNRPIIKDPMVVEEEAKSEETPIKVTRGEKTIAVLAEEAATEDRDTEAPTQKDDSEEVKKELTPESEPPKEVEPPMESEPKKDAEPPKPSEPAKPEPEEVVEAKNGSKLPDLADEPEEKPLLQPELKPETETEQPETMPSEETPATTEEKPDEVKTDDKPTKGPDGKPVDTTNKEFEVEVAEQTKHDEAVQKMVDSRQYYLPINSVEKRKSKRFVALGIILSIVLALAWIDIALDSGIIDISGIDPVTHFFSN